MKRKTKRRLARENPNWRLKVYDDKALLADNGPYVTQRAALVDAKELARRRAAVQGQRVVSIRTRAGRDSAYKTVDVNGEATGFFAVPGAVPGTELRYNPKSSPVPYLLLWAQRNGGDLKQQAGGRVAATFPNEAAARGFAAELQVYGATGVTSTRAGFWPKGPYTFTVAGTLPALANPKRRAARANHHLAPGQRAAGEVRVVKPLGMRGKADYYIVEGHRLRAEAGTGAPARKNRGKLPSMYPGLPPSPELIALVKRYQGKLHGVKAYAPGYGFPVDFSGAQAHARASAFAQEVHQRHGLNPDMGGAQGQGKGKFRVWANMLDR